MDELLALGASAVDLAGAALDFAEAWGGIALDLGVAVLAVVALIAALCRVDALRYRQHRMSIILMHVGIGFGCVFAGMHALLGQTDTVDVAMVATSLAWMRASYRNWRNGVPAQYSTSPAPFDEAPQPVPQAVDAK